MSAPLRILISRTDNLGDLLLSLPAIQLVRKNNSNAKVALLAKKPFLDLLHSFLVENEIAPLDLEESEWRIEKWDAVLSLYSRPQEAAYFLLKKIPNRFGNLTHWWSPLLFNKGFRQKRSKAQKSEADYSIELAKALIQELGENEEQGSSIVYLPIDTKEEQQAIEKLKDLGIDPSSSFVVLHPGMAGSALNLSPDQYEEIIQKVSKVGTVLISIGPNSCDQEIGKKLSLAIPGLMKIEGLSLKALKEVFRKSRAVIAPSTGPLHLAHAVGVPTIGIYSPIRSHHPTRWAPKGGRIKPIILMPSVQCPAQRACLGSKCSEFDCFRKPDWASLILNALNGLT